MNYEIIPTQNVDQHWYCLFFKLCVPIHGVLKYMGKATGLFNESLDPYVGVDWGTPVVNLSALTIMTFNM